MHGTQPSPILEKFLDKVTVIIGCGMVLYHLFSSQYLFLNPMLQGNVALSFSLILVFLGALSTVKTRIHRFLCLVLLLLSIFATCYFHVEYDRLEMIVGFPEPKDVVVSIFLIIVVIEATRRAFGLILPLVGLLFVFYFFLGHLIPQPFGHAYYEPNLVLSYLSVGFTGVFQYLPIATNMIFLFVVFGALIQALGAHQFIFEIGKWVGRRTAGGIGQTAVVGSSMVGMFTGVGIANVAITGAFTIPLMKNSGYSPEEAGAIESTASTGAQIVPPVMGASAFLMAYLLEEAYVTIMLAAIIPAIVFYLSIFLAVEAIARKGKIERPIEQVSWGVLLRRSVLFIIPIVVITIVLVMRYTPMLAAFYAIISVVVVSFFLKETRPSLSVMARGFTTGAVVGAKIIVAVGVVGLLTQSLVTTGLAIKLGGLVETLAGGNLPLLLFLCMIVCILLGCGMPPIAAYLVVAMVVCPVLIRARVDPLAAHFFAFYFALLSAVTPPVAVCALAASALANSKFWHTCLKAFKLAIVGFILPYLWVYNFSLLGRFSHPLTTALTYMAVIGGLISLTGLLYGFLYTKVPYWAMPLLFFTATAMFISIVTTKQYLFFGIALLLFIPIILQQWISSRHLEHKKGGKMSSQ